MKYGSHRGFTMIELMVAAAIIGLLTSVVLVSVSNVRAKARDTQRLHDLRQIQTALENYRNDRGAYPNTVVGDPNNPEWFGACGSWNASYKARSGPNGWIPNLAPIYMPVLPVDPRVGPAASNCYVYRSTGSDYMVIAYGSVETVTSTDTNNGTCTPTKVSTDTNPANRPSMPTEADFAFFTPNACRW